MYVANSIVKQLADKTAFECLLSFDKHLTAMKICHRFGMRTEHHFDDSFEKEIVSLGEVKILLDMVSESLYDIVVSRPTGEQVSITCELVDLMAEMRFFHNERNSNSTL
jgi:hypothetical protein